jgi:hypothetical protein
MNEQLAAIKAQAEGGHLDVMVVPKADVLAIFAEVERLQSEVYRWSTEAMETELQRIKFRDAMHDAQAETLGLRSEVERLTGELAAEHDAAKRHAAYIASCVDECGSYQP